MKKRLLIVLSIVCMLLLVGCGDKKNEKNDIKNNVPQNDNNEITNVVSKEDDDNNNEKSEDYAEEYLEVVNDAKKENGDLKYDLIYFDNDSIPELVVNDEGYWVSLYSYKDGKLVELFKQWPYGAMGNTGYKYAKKSGVILNSNSDYAGSIITDTYYILNNKSSFDELSATELGAELDKDDDMYEQVMDAINNYGGYNLNGNKITEKEFNDKLQKLNVSNNDFVSLEASKSYSEIVSELK